MKQPIRWGILSTARIAQSQIIPAIRATGNGAVAAVASRDAAKARTFADKLEIPKAYGSYQELLDDPDIDAIYNPLPTSLHAGWSIAAARAGKPVLGEKPLAANAAEAESMIAAFAKRKLLLSEALMFRYHPLTRRVKALVEEGAIGRLVLLDAHFGIRAEADDIRLRKETGGGGLLDLGCYCLAYQRYLAGEEPSSVKAVALLNDAGVDVNLTASLLFPSGVAGRFGCSLVSAFDCRYAAWGENGRLSVERGALCAWPGEKFIIRLWSGSDYREVEVPAANPYQLLVEDFHAALTEGKPMDITPEDALNNMRAIDAVRSSLA